jgi:predicted DNA-binding transcriptional regulator AlpA
VHHLVGTAEIAVMLGVTRERVRQLYSAEGFPKPVARLSAGLIWERADIERWARRDGRLAEDEL